MIIQRLAMILGTVHSPFYSLAYGFGADDATRCDDGSGPANEYAKRIVCTIELALLLDAAIE